MLKKDITELGGSLKTIQQMAKFNNSIVAGKQLRDFNKSVTNHLNASNATLKLATELTASQKIADALTNKTVLKFRTADLLSDIQKRIQEISYHPDMSKMTFSDFKYISSEDILKSLKLDFNVSNIIDATTLKMPSFEISQELLEALSYTEENASANERQEIEKIIDDTNAVIDDAFQKTEKGIEILMAYLKRLSESKIAGQAKEYTMQVIIAIVANILYAIIAEKIHLVEDKPNVIVNQYNTTVNVDVNSGAGVVVPSTVVYTVGKEYTTLILKKMEKSKKETKDGLIKIPIGSKIVLKAVYTKWIEISVSIDGHERIGFTQKDGLAEIE